ncbi:MAG: hypothetical protein OEM67_12540, partial [Thermoleophilia bacterium]|nr:hypothetical protein [Thermoleophilia bacterium]
MTKHALSVALTLVLMAVGTPRLSAQVDADSTEVDSESAPVGPAFEWDPNDPRVGLGAGWMNAESAARGLQLVASAARPLGFFNPATPDDRRFFNSDLAFKGDLLFQGNYQGFQIFDISDPAALEPVATVLCPGGQGDVSVYGDILVVSAQETRGRLDCGLEGVADSISTE